IESACSRSTASIPLPLPASDLFSRGIDCAAPLPACSPLQQAKDLPRHCAAAIQPACACESGAEFPRSAAAGVECEPHRIEGRMKTQTHHELLFRSGLTCISA